MILMYHGVVLDEAGAARSRNGQAIPVSGLRRQLEWLRERRDVLPLEAYLAGTENGRPARSSVALTFDDGLRETYALLSPLLSELGLPATLFVTTGHLDHGPLLWFTYLNALCLESDYAEIQAGGRSLPLSSWRQRVEARAWLEQLALGGEDPAAFARQLERRYPLAGELVAAYEGMRFADVAAAGRSRLLEVGAHSVTHPWLGRRPGTVQEAEVMGSRDCLAGLIGRPVRYFAYPGGDYTAETLRVVREAGFEAAVATIPKDLGADPQYEIGRVGVYSASLSKLRLKLAGAAEAARRLGFHVG
jgi:peptidoglycan/xylan/chitin deacetylase (PgdA/CDA1 family)